VRKSAPVRTQLERQRRGAQAEERAALLLRQAGYDIVARNFRCRVGELDIVARRGAVLIIAEVRLRSSTQFGGAAGSITGQAHSHRSRGALSADAPAGAGAAGSAIRHAVAEQQCRSDRMDRGRLRRGPVKCPAT
jgi:hypothetical protein